MRKYWKKIVVGLAAVLAVSIIGPAIKLSLFDKQEDHLLVYSAFANRLESLNGAVVLRDSYDEAIAESEKKKEEYEKKRQELLKEQQNLTSEYNNILDYIADMDKKQNDIMLEMVEVENEKQRLEDELEQTQVKLQQAEEIAEKQYANMKKRLQYIYENGSTTYLEMLMSAKSLTDLLNQVEYVNQITEYDNQLLNRYLDAKNEVAEYQKFVEAKLEAVELTQSMYEDDYKYAQQILAKKQEAVEKYEKEMNTNEGILEEYLVAIANEEMSIKEAEAAQAEEIRKREEERKRQEALAAAQNKPTSPANVPSTGYQNAASVPKSDVTDPNKMIWPLPGDGSIGSGFGPRVPPTAGASSYHKGVDIGGAMGAQIVAALAGTVTEASYNNSGGYHVYIDHGNGYVTRYLHCSKMYVSAGDYVKQGQVIALVGSTGISTSAHLHFSVYKNGVAVDPLLYISY